MKRIILLWLLTAMLLCGCAIAAETTESAAATPDTDTAPPESFFAWEEVLDQQAKGALRAYHLDMADCYDVAAMGEQLLVFSRDSGGTWLTLLVGEEGYPSAMRRVETELFADQTSTQVTKAGISWFDTANRETQVLDENLREITRIPAPEGMTGEPLLSADRRWMYYSTAEGIWVLELATGIPRLLRQHTGELSPQRLLMDGTVLQCREAGQEGVNTVFLSVEAGQILRQEQGNWKIAASGQRYIALPNWPEQSQPVFGTGSGVPQTLYTDSTGESWLLPESYGVLQASAGEDLCLDYFDLFTGLRRSSFSVEETEILSVADGGDGILWLLDSGNTLYRWDTNALFSADTTVYSGIYYTRSNPDLSGIARCQALAEEIGERHGVEILVWEDALKVVPWDYRFVEAYQVPVLEAQLRLLDQRLGNFPEGFLSQLAPGLTISLVQSIEGDVDYGALDDASGLQYWVEDHAYIALSTVHATEGGLYHELCHVFDTRVIGKSNAYDQWEELNPNGFRYDYDYAANATRNAGEYLRDAERCFIDTYSMSYPKEDRARILEYAMTPGNEHYFRSEVMQAKLRQICLGLREAFGLKKSEDTFLWEQYLHEAVACEK